VVTYQEYKDVSIKNLLKRLLFDRPIINVRSSSHSDRALLSYSVYHFRGRGGWRHSNYYESNVIVEVLDDFGYKVDVVNDTTVGLNNLHNYKLVIGEGFPLLESVEKSNAKRFYYSAGSHPCFSSLQSIRRSDEFLRRYQIVPYSGHRVLPFEYGMAVNSAHYVSCIGNDVTASSFARYGVVAETLRPTFVGEDIDFYRVLPLKSSLRSSCFVWFGSAGFIHKGLDLLIEAFRNRPSQKLIVCGLTPADSRLIDLLEPPSNVVRLGTIDVSSYEFMDLMGRCSFCILPSCAEGCSTGVITCAAHGGLIPIVSEFAGIDFLEGLTIPDLSISGILDSIDVASSLSGSEMNRMSALSYSRARSLYSRDGFRRRITQLLGPICSSLH